MIKPANFDSTKVYPLLMYVYGEPAGQTAQDSWGGGHLWEHMIADQGYVVATVDNRGTPSPRGRAATACRDCPRWPLRSPDPRSCAPTSDPRPRSPGPSDPPARRRRTSATDRLWSNRNLRA